MPAQPLRLGVNIDHVATLRQARYSGIHEGPTSEPSLVAAAEACTIAGAHSLTIHLREDRRHIQESDARTLAERRLLPLNLEMANTAAMLEFALELNPDDVCIVPEKRREVTTESGLDVLAEEEALKTTIAALGKAGIRTSLFIDPEIAQVEAAARVGAPVIELHTGAFSNAATADPSTELSRLDAAARRAHALGLQVNAGHGINYNNIPLLLTLPHLVDLNIGHSIVSRAVFVGLAQAVAEMLEAMRDYPRTATK